MTYEIVLGSAAIRTIERLPEPEQGALADALRTELVDGPNVKAALLFVCEIGQYTATPLSFKAYTAVHRPMTEGELSRLSREQQRPTAETGFYVPEIRGGESAFIRRPADQAVFPPLAEPPNLPAARSGRRVH
jgi:hypothetical protein